MLLIAGFVGLFGDRREGDASPEVRAKEQAAQVISLPPPDLLRPLSPEEAAKANTERPFVKRADTAAPKFVLKAGVEDRERALTCLSQAVYYEAGAEGAEGEQAVAQVVLNRLHHPAYPASVCGVVYQGSERGTGCQFTFTCDGSLLREPVPALWSRARKIAEAALSGKVFSPIGHATHYHADYVLPYWADSLDKTIQIGRHIFYRLRSSLGDRRAFVQRYAGTEPNVRPPSTAVVLPESAMTGQLASALLSDNVKGPPKDVEKAGQPIAPQLAADIKVGSLIMDGDASASTRPHASKVQADCPSGRDVQKLAPLGRAEMRARGSSPSC